MTKQNDLTGTSKARVDAPFAWYGGKQNLAPWLIERFPDHQRYVEPFGGAGNVLFAKPPSVFEVYNDLDGRVVETADHGIGVDQHPLQNRHQTLEVVPHFDLQQRVDAMCCELLTDPRTVGVHDLTEQKFGSHGDDITPHCSPSPWPLVHATDNEVR
jgi:hypothetical protein